MQSESEQSAPSGGLKQIVNNFDADPSATSELPTLGEFDAGTVPPELSEINEREPTIGRSDAPENQVEVPDQYRYVPDPSKENNVMLAPSRKDDALPAGLAVVGRRSFIIPDVETQAAGFYVDDAPALVGQFRQYKFMTPKGENAPSVQI
jgi:hypothetical protein